MLWLRNVLVHTEYKDESSPLRQVCGFGVFLALICYHSVREPKPRIIPKLPPPPHKKANNKTTPANQPISPPPRSTFFCYTNGKQDFLSKKHRSSQKPLGFFPSHTRYQWTGAHPLDNRACICTINYRHQTRYYQEEKMCRAG